MSESQWNYNISQGYTANLKPFKTEVKSGLTRTGELAIQQNSQLNYSQQQMFQKGGPSDMQNQLKLLKSKMTQQQFLSYDDIDRQANNLSSELSTLNSRLQNKQTYQSNYHDQSAAIPRNRAQNKIPQMGGLQTIEINSPQSQNSTNITSFVYKDNHIHNQQINHQSNSYQPSINKTRENSNNQTNYSQNINQPNLRTQESQPKDLSSRINKQFSQFQEKQDQRSLYEPSMYEIQPADKKQVNRLNKPQNQDNSPQNYKKQNNYQESPQQPQQVNKPQERNLFIQQQKPYQIPQVKQVINTRQQAPINPQIPANQTFQIDEVSAVAKQKPQLPQISEDEDQELMTCPEGCGRQFNQGAMLKHKKICKKVFQTKRKQFNSKAHRIIEQEQVKLEKQGQKQEKIVKQKQQLQKDSVGDPKWKKQSEQFRQMISTTQNDQPHAVQNNALEDDYVQCGSCGRKFNENAASRHIPGCKTRTLKNANR